jgi:hypothetical protein
MDTHPDDDPPYEPTIIRHAERTTPLTPPASACDHLADIEAHLAKHFGRVETVLHEIVSDIVHIDVLVVPATQERPFHVLMTSGMSDLPMTVPEGHEQFAHAELAIALPGYWPISGPEAQDEANYWPIRWLKMLARLPHEYATWIGVGHSIPNSDPPEPIANTRYVGVAVSLPFFAPQEFMEIATSSGRTIHVYTLVPLHREEMDLKLAKGWEHVCMELFNRQLGIVIEPQRRSVARRRRWWWPFG